jgi:hypothetical protein
MNVLGMGSTNPSIILAATDQSLDDTSSGQNLGPLEEKKKMSI